MSKTEVLVLFLILIVGIDLFVTWKERREKNP
jgi:hypothetical protein